MWRVGIIDGRGELERHMRENLADMPLELESYRPDSRYDAVVIAEGERPERRIDCEIAVLPGDARLRLDARSAVSYGMSESDTVTLASGKDGCAVSLRRDIIGFAGETVCRQDAVFDFTLPAEYALPIAAVAMLCTG